ncbi:TPA: translation initiation factor IF-6 [Candidatus Geothermarchaeota archaeon]|nr:translation initiation factor IF-6 [Candidatus Geothermarchaeota archaeon]HIQ13068.1 translation initiation factor IF-6 [Thermoprotei archaeon]
MLKIKIFGSSNIGLYLYATNKYLLYHSSIPNKKVEMVTKELKVPPIKLYLTDTLITAPFIVGNSNGLLIPDIFEDFALEQLKKDVRDLDINVAIISSKYNALGNIIVANDHGALISPIIPFSLKKMISDALDVEVSTITVGRFSYIGSLVVTNSKSGLVAPMVREDEKEILEDLLKVKLYEGTINGGGEFIKLGLVVNDYGVVVGDATSGAELMNISSVFEGD